ncbi:MAG: 4-hydroxythreonine-4-phosphate dehydrogenase PdxA [Phycisphaerales bacterium]
MSAARTGHDRDAPSAPRRTIAVTLGDPGGIGPEVIAKALSDRSLRMRARWRILGPAAALQAAAEAAGLEPYWWRVDHASPVIDTTAVHDVVVLDYAEAEPPFPARATKAGGELSFRLVEDAIALARRPAADPLHAAAIVTGPISKHAWSLAGRGQYPGHTELLATRFGAKRSGMMFVTPRLRVILATAHIPLMDLRNILTIGRVFDAIDLGAGACRRLGITGPRIAVCGLNPHAGEHGLLGDEEQRLIEPAIRAAAEGGIDVRGPFPADTVFNAAIAGAFDLVVAMYHDQGLIPVKLLDRDRAVNVTVGLPITRTSPDHGTAFDIAGRNRADPGSMAAAMALAVEMAAST